jgi:rubrerythrin
MIASWPLPRTAYVCDVCGQPGIGTKNQLTCPRAACQAEKRKRVSAKESARAKAKREEKRV